MYPCNIYQADLDVNKLRMSSDTDILLQDFATKAVITAENHGLLTTYVTMLFSLIWEWENALISVYHTAFLSLFWGQINIDFI